MSRPRLEAELLDYIVDFLHDTEVALKSCSLVSESWIPRTRRHLFAEIKFESACTLQSWTSMFPDPSTSPGYYAKTLSIGCPQDVIAADAEEGGWLQAFSRVVKLNVYDDVDDGSDLGSTVSLVPLYGLFPVLKSLDINVSSVAPSQVSGLIYSFPLLEDVLLTAHEGMRDDDDFDKRPTAVSPAFTGSLRLHTRKGFLAIAGRLFPPPGVLRFWDLSLRLNNERDFGLATEFVDRCSSTVETLRLDHTPRSTWTYQADLWQELTAFADRSPAGESINLSKATKLKDVVFGTHLDPKWIIASLRAVTHDHRDLQQITITIPYVLYHLDPQFVDGVRFMHTDGEAMYQRWLELDRVLAQMRESRSVRLKVLYNSPSTMERRARGCVEELLPEVTTRGTVKVVKGVY